jgi:NAD(P)-dependent dehydrogenase (short-subunit alcohol dehydrogenase family)
MTPSLCGLGWRRLIQETRYVKTSMTEAYVRDPVKNDYILGRTPAKRWGVPEDFRGTVIFLASPASDFVTGTTILVDGGIIGL